MRIILILSPFEAVGKSGIWNAVREGIFPRGVLSRLNIALIPLDWNWNGHRYVSLTRTKIKWFVLWYSNANVFEETAEGINQKMKSLCDYFLFKFCSYKKRVIMEIFFGDASFPLECFVLWYCGIGWPLHPPSLCHIRLPECLVKSQYVLILFPISIFWYSLYTLHFIFKSISLTTRSKERVQKYQWKAHL